MWNRLFRINNRVNLEGKGRHLMSTLQEYFKINELIFGHKELRMMNLFCQQTISRRTKMLVACSPVQAEFEPI
jgi:hypothetical protein